jgi:hypothetical protein
MKTAPTSVISTSESLYFVDNATGSLDFISIPFSGMLCSLNKIACAIHIRCEYFIPFIERQGGIGMDYNIYLFHGIKDLFCVPDIPFHSRNIIFTHSTHILARAAQRLHKYFNHVSFDSRPLHNS